MKENHNKEQKLDLEWTMYSSNGPKRHFHSAKILEFMFSAKLI